jgi:hypothetical protein
MDQVRGELEDGEIPPSEDEASDRRAIKTKLSSEYQKEVDFWTKRLNVGNRSQRRFAKDKLKRFNEKLIAVRAEETSTPHKHVEAEIAETDDIDWAALGKMFASTSETTQAEPPDGSIESMLINDQQIRWDAQWSLEDDIFGCHEPTATQYTQWPN